MTGVRRSATVMKKISKAEPEPPNGSLQVTARGSALETLLANLSSTIVNTPFTELDHRIEDALRRLVEVLDVDRAAFGEIADNGTVMLTHFYVLPGVPTCPRTITDRQMPWWSDRVRRGDIMALTRLPDDLPLEAAAERDHCTNDGIRSHLAIPISVGGAVLCILTFVSIRREQNWPPALISRLRLLGEVFANAVARRRITATFQ